MVYLDNVTIISLGFVKTERTIKVLSACNDRCGFKSTKIITNYLGSTNGVEKVFIDTPEFTYKDFNKFIIKELYKYINTDYVLLIQEDGYVLDGDAWRDDFLKYDYIGAPWWWYNDSRMVGNGGFSLRSKRFCEFVATAPGITPLPPGGKPFYEYCNEDHLLCRVHRDYIMENGYTFAPFELANKFSIENGRWLGQFGFHGRETLVPEYMKI